jgi:uncharacterized membrane protein
MTKRGKLALFMVGATLFNILLTALLFVGILALYSLTIGQLLKVPSAGLAITVSFVIAIVISSIVYKKLLEYLRKRIDFDATFNPKANSKKK